MTQTPLLESQLQQRLRSLLFGIKELGEPDIALQETVNQLVVGSIPTAGANIKLLSQ
jgi:hypothetical protein